MADKPFNPFDEVLETAEPSDIVAIYDIDANEKPYTETDADGNEVQKRKPAERFFDGVPLRDLTAADVRGIKEWIQRGLIESGLYRLA